MKRTLIISAFVTLALFAGSVNSTFATDKKEKAKTETVKKEDKKCDGCKDKKECKETKVSKKAKKAKVETPKKETPAVKK